jgi:hypothetical protein
MKRTTCISTQSKHPYGLVLGLAGVVGGMGLIVPMSVQPPRATTHRYDDLNRLIEVINPDGTRSLIHTTRRAI